MDEIINDIAETVLPVDTEVTSNTEVPSEMTVEASEPTTTDVSVEVLISVKYAKEKVEYQIQSHVRFVREQV